MGYQKDIAKQIVKGKADYALVLKGNHSGMKAELEAWRHKSMREGTTSDMYDEYCEVSVGHQDSDATHRARTLLVH